MVEKEREDGERQLKESRREFWKMIKVMVSKICLQFRMETVISVLVMI